MASPSQSEHFKGLPEPLQQRALREQSTRLASDGQIPLLPDSFATPPKRFSAKAEATPYPNFEKTTPPPEVTPAAQMKLESAGASTGPVPVMQGIKVLIEEKEKELTALSERRARGVEAHAKSLAEDLRRKEAEAATLHNQLSQLTSDFKYNLKLLDERDAELEKQDQELLAFRKSVADMEGQLHEVHREGGQWREESERLRQRVEEMEEAIGAYQEVVAKVRDQLEDAKRLRDEEVAKQAAETGVLKAHLAELNAQHEAEVKGAVQRAEESFEAERAAMEKRVAEMRSKLEEAETRRREEVRVLQAEIEAVRDKANERVAEEREKGKREVQNVQKTIDEMNVCQLKLEEEHRTETELLRKKLGAEYAAALLRLQEEHGADVSARARAFEREREALERRAGAWEEERLTLAARLEAAEREARGAGVKWEERIRALQEERKQGEHHAQALQSRVAELEGVTSSQSAELENAQRQSRMLQTLVDDLHAALQAKDEATRGLQKRLDELEGASAAALAALERDKAEAEASLRQQLLADYEAKVAELLDALRAMEEHVASETDATSRKLTEQVEAHGREMERLEGLLEKSQLKVEGLEKACKDSKNERERERDDAQFVKSTLAARDAEVELLRGEVETIQKEVEKLSEERTVRTREERIRTEEASALRVELSAREAEVARLAEMLENARAQNEGLGFGAARNEGLGFAAAKRSARDGVLDFGAAGGSAEGCGDLGADGFALVRKLAAENEVLRRRLSSAEATVSNPTLNLAPNPASNPGDLPERRLTHEAPQKSRIVRPYSRGDVRTVSGFTDGEEEARTGEYGQREVFQGTGLGTGLERLGLNERGFVTDSCLPEGIQTDTSRLFSPAVLQLQEEMQAVRRRVEALKPSHVAAAAAPGLEVIQNELLQLKAVVQSLAAPDSAQWKSGTPERSDSTREAGRVGNQAGERAAQTDAVTLNVLQEMKENVASLRGELDSLQRAAAVQRVDTPFASPVAGSVGGFRTGVDIGRLSEPAEGFAGGFGESPIALTERVGHYGREPSGVHQQMTPAGTAADVAALQESVLQLTRELLEMRSAAAPVGSNSASGFASAQGPPQLLTSGEAEKGNGGGQVFAAEKGAHSTKGEGARNDLSGAERNRIGRNGSALVPSELLQREIADARAELAALRSGSKGFPVSGTNRNGPESGGGHVSERAEAGEERRSLVRWVDANLTGSVEPAGSDCGEAAATGNSSWGRFLGEAGGIPSAPLLTWTDLATCLEQSENVPGSGSFVSARAVIGGGVRSGASVQVAQRFESSDAKYASATTYTTSNASGNGRKWGQSSVTLPLRASKPAVKVVPRTGANGPVVDRKEKQNKVGYAPKMTWASPASVFQVVSK